MLEIWKDIAGYEGLYQVSNTGKVRSLNWRNRGEIKELSPRETKTGQIQVELSKDGKRKVCAVQRLVEEAFPPEIPEETTTPEATPKPAGRPIWQLSIYGEPIKQWEDVAQIQKEQGYQSGSILECCMSMQKAAYGFKWQYANEYEGRSS